MFNIISILFKYIFIIIIYLFIFSIMRLIYLDIKTITNFDEERLVYLKLINRNDSLPYKLKEYYIIEDSLKLGRSNSNDIIIKDPFVSKDHFLIVKDEEKYFLEDLASSNGTYINNNRIYDAVELKGHDIIRISNVELLFVNKK